MALGQKIIEKEVFGEAVHIKRLNSGKVAAQVLDLMQQMATKPSLLLEAGALLVVACLCDKDGTLLHTDPEKVREEAAIGFLKEFFEAALDHSGLGEDAAEAAKNG